MQPQDPTTAIPAPSRRRRWAVGAASAVAAAVLVGGGAAAAEAASTPSMTSARPAAAIAPAAASTPSPSATPGAGAKASAKQPARAALRRLLAVVIRQDGTSQYGQHAQAAARTAINGHPAAFRHLPQKLRDELWPLAGAPSGQEAAAAQTVKGHALDGTYGDAVKKLAEAIQKAPAKASPAPSSAPATPSPAPSAGS
ncbi:hypothetical protein GCM10027449_05750 [Sinomonas notoginsengisoli]